MGRRVYSSHSYTFSLDFGGIRSDQSSFKTKTSSGTEVFTGFFGQSSFASHSIVSMNSLLKVDPSTPLEQVCSFGCGIQTGFGTVLNTLLPSIQPRNFSHLPSINDLKLPISSPSLAAKPQQPHTLAIFGLGAVGMGAVVAGHLAKDIIQHVVVIDLVESRLDMAKQAGATHFVNASGKTAEQVVEEVKKASVDGRGATISFEATGVPAVLTNALNCLAPRGRCAMAGAAPAGPKVDLEISELLVSMGLCFGKSESCEPASDHLPPLTRPLQVQQWSLAGMIEGDSDPEIFIPYMLAQAKRGAFDIMKQLVKTYKPEEMEQAMKDAKSGQVVKPVIVWD
jgi:aryl-alcohol dehydrogenase